MKLTNKAKTTLDEAARKIDRALAFLDSDSVQVCRVRKYATNATDYVPYNGTPFQSMPAVLTPIDHATGCELAVLSDALRIIRAAVVAGRI